MTSTNDGKDVKSNQTSGHKSKSYYIELYTSLEKALSGDGSLEERTGHVCEAWRRVYSLYQHSAASTHPHLLSWLQRHTANTVLQSKWAKSKNEQARLTNALDSLVAEATAAAAGREQHPWERLLLQRAAWFRRALENPWDNPVLKSLINPNSDPVTDHQVLEWLISEHGVVLVTRLQRMVGAGNCDDLALLLASAVMDRARAAIPQRADDRADERVEEEDSTSFVAVLEREASFTADEWEMLTDIELVLLLKTDKRPRCIELAKLTPLRHGYKMVERLRKRLEMSPRDKKLWKHAKEVATLVAQVVIARCMVLGSCAGAARDALYWCARALARLVRGSALRGVSTALAAPAATARHLHTFCAALSAECKELKTDVIMKPFICELYVRAITAGMNELEQLKLNAEKESEARLYEQTLAGWFTQLGGRLADSARLRAECALTAFSVHPARAHYERVAAAPPPPRQPQAQEPTLETTSEYGSWANDSRTQSNLVKTSETLQLKQSQQHQANVMSTAILTEGEALGLEPELCQDLAVLLSGPRVKTLSWDMDREVLLENCRAYMEKTHGGTRAVTTELKYLNLDPDAYRHLPEEADDESDLFYGIEKGYEHEVQLEEPENIWQNAFFDPEQTETAYESEEEPKSKKKNKALSSEDDEDPLSNIAEAKREKKKLAKEKRIERRKKTHKRDDSKGDSRERRKDKEKKTKKERKKDKSEQSTTGSLTSLLGMKVTKMSEQMQDGEKRVRKKKERRRQPATMFSYVGVTYSDYEDQEKSSQVSQQDPNVVVDGVFSMDELRVPDRTIDAQKPKHNTDRIKNKATVQSPVIQGIKARPVKSPLFSTASSDSDVSRAKSPYLTPNQLGPRHVVNSKVKSSITKLLQFRRNRSQVRDVPRPPPSHTPTTPTHSLVGMKIQNPEDVPKGNICLNRKQSKQLEALSKEVSDLFKEARSSINNYRATPEMDNKLQNQNSYNVQKYQQIYNNPHHTAQNVYHESQKLSDHTQHSPIRPAHQNMSCKSPCSVIHTNISPVKTPEHTRTHPLNLSPPKPTMSYQTFHKSMQNLSTDAKHPPKKPQLIYDPNYFSLQHGKSKASQVSPRIISNTCIKPPSETPTNVQQCPASVKDNITKSPQTQNSQIIDSKEMKYGQRQLSSSMQNISETPGRYDADKSHFTPPNMQLGQAAKLYSMTSQSHGSNTSRALYNSNNSTASRCLPIQHREKIDKIPHKSNTEDNLEYLKELMKSMNASNVIDKSVSIALNKDVKVTPVPPSTAAAKRIDSVNPQCAKQLIQQRRTENAPNTFSRRSYMHKNKQNEKVNLTDVITLELNRTMMDHKISKAKCLKNEVTISRVGRNTQDSASVIKKIEQPSSRLQRDCPVLSSMLDSSGSPKIQTVVSNTSINHTSGNQVNREDADLLLLLRNQTILKPNVSPKETLPSDLTSGQTFHNQQIKLDGQISSSHQGLVGTKVKNIDVLDNTSPIKKEPEDNKPLEWKRVMDALLAQKTEPLGPNALDLALKKGYRKNSQSSSRVHSSDKHRVSGQSSSHTKLVDPKKREHQNSKTSSSRKPSTERHSEVPKKPREPDIIKRVASDTFNRHEIPNKHFHPTTIKDVPHTPVLNTDYDILDDLIDDDLRRELGEISSEEEAYSAPNTALLKGKAQSTIPKSNDCKSASIPKENPHIVNLKTIPKNETKPSTIDCHREFAVNTCPKNTAAYSNVITNNSSHLTHTENKPAAVVTPEANIPTSNIITGQVARDTANNIVTSHVGANQFVSNILPAKVIIASVPQPPVVVIRQDLVYDPYPTIRIHESQVSAELCSINQNMYALNAAPNIAVYQTTQYAAPVINPVIIGNAMTTTNVSNATAMGSDHDTNDSTKKVIKQNQSDITLEEALKLTDDRNQVPETSTKSLELAIGHSGDRTHTSESSTNLDFNMNRNCERKVLSQMQEKHAYVNMDQDTHLKRSPADATDGDRIRLKRQSLMNRKISHVGYHPPIPLTYTPLTTKVILEKHLQQETLKNGIVKPNVKSVPNNTSDTEKCVVISPFVESPKPETNNENIQSTEKSSHAKENQKSCRRIWLRSSNKIRNKVSPVKLPRVPLRRNKINGTITDKAIAKIANLESDKEDSVKKSIRVSNRILNKVKLDKPVTIQPINQEKTQESVVENNELIDFEEALSSSIVLKTPTAIAGTENQSKQNPKFKRQGEKEELASAEHENLNTTKDTNVASPSSKTSHTRLEPTVVIEKLESKLSDQLIIKCSSVNVPVKKAKVIVIKKPTRTALRNKSVIKKCITLRDPASNKIVIKSAPKNTVSETSSSTVPDKNNQIKPVIIIDQKVIKTATLTSPIVRVETLTDQKVIEQVSADGLPITVVDKNKSNPALDDHNLSAVNNQKVTKQTTTTSSEPVIQSSKVKPTVKDDVQVNETTTVSSEPDLEEPNKKPMNDQSQAVNIQQISNQTTFSGLSVMVDEINTVKSTIVVSQNVDSKSPSVELPLNLKESDALKPEVSDDQKVIKQPGLASTRSSAIQNRHHDSPNCMKVLSEFEIKNNQPPTLTTTIAHLDNEKTFRATETKPDTVTNKANTTVKSNRSAISVNTENSTGTNAKCTKHNEIDSLPNRDLSSQMSDNVDLGPRTQKNNEEINDILETDDMQPTTEIQKSNDNVGITDKDHQIDSRKSLLSQVNIDDEAAAKSDPVGKKEDLPQILSQEQVNVSSKLNHDNDQLKRNEDLKTLSVENAKRPNLPDVLNKDKQTHTKGDIKIEELPILNNKEPNKKLVRISLPNGKVFRATIHGKMQGDFDSLFADPAMRSILAGSLNDGKRYTVNYKQVCKANKTNPTKIIGTQIQDLNIKETQPSTPPIDTVNLISDDEDEVPTRSFITEFGKYNTSVDEETFTLHQKKLNQKCEVKMYREDIFKSNKTKPKTNVSKSSLLTRNKSKQLSNIGASIEVGMTTNVFPEIVCKTDIIREMINRETHEIEIPIPNLEQSRNKSKQESNTSAPIEVGATTNVFSEIDINRETHEIEMPIPNLEQSRNKSKQVSNIIAPIEAGTTTNLFSEIDIIKETHDIETPIPNLEQSNSAPRVDSANVIEIDDSSNDSIKNGTPKTDDNVNLEPVEKLIELKSLLLHDLGVRIDKDVNFPAPKEKAVDNLKNALLQDLGIVEDPVIDITADDENEAEISTDSQKQNKHCLKNNPVDDTRQNEEKSAPTTTDIQKQQEQQEECLEDNLVNYLIQNDGKEKMLKHEKHDNLKCFVRLVKCDKLVKKYELLKSMKKCYVRVERLNGSTLKSGTPILYEKTNNEITNKIKETNSDATYEINEDNSDDIIEFDVEEPSSSPQLSRFPSLSILNNWDDDSQPLEIPYPTSPVMEIYDTIVQLRNKLKTELVRDTERPCSWNCDSEWTVTKFGYRIQGTLLRSSDIPSLEKKIVPCCDNLMVSDKEKLFITFDAPKLLTITLQFIQDNRDAIYRLESMRSLRRILATKTSPNKLKRKTEEIVNDTAASKILKLGTLALNSMNSCIKVLDNIRFHDRIEENMTVQTDASSIENSNHVLIQSLLKDKVMTNENIKYDKQITEFMSTADIENSRPEKNQTDLVAENNKYVSQFTENTINKDINSSLQLILQNDNSDKTEYDYKYKVQTTYKSQPEENNTDMYAQCVNNEENPNLEITFTRVNEETVLIGNSSTSSTSEQVEEKSKDETQGFITNPQCENFVEYASPNMHVALTKEGTNTNAGENVPIADSNTSPKSEKLEECYMKDPKFYHTENTITDQHGQYEYKDCFTSTISVPLVNENTNESYLEETVHISDLETSPADPITEEKFNDELKDNDIDNLAEEISEPEHREPDFVNAKCEQIKIDESIGTSVNANLSVENSVSCLPSESFCDRNVAGDNQKVESPSPLTNITQAGDTQSQIRVNDCIEQAATEFLHIVNSDRWDEIPIDEIPNNVYEVEVVDSHIHDCVERVEKLQEKSQQAVTVTNTDSSEVSHQDPEIKSPVFIDSKQIAFNYHDYTKQPKKREDSLTNFKSKNVSDRNNYKDLLNKECASGKDNSTTAQVDLKEAPCCDDTPTNHREVNTSENCLLKSNPECKYDIIQEDDLLTVKITTESNKDDTENKTVFVGSNDAGEEIVASLCSDEAEDNIDIKGFEFEDIYVFPLNQSASNCNTSNDSLSPESNRLNDTVHENLHDIDLHVIKPEITYSRKRKMNMRDIRVPAKKYRKGKNIDCSKQTVISMTELAYGKEYKRLLEYCSSVKFSYTRPYHKECYEVDDLMSNWPLSNVTCDVPSDAAEEHLFVDLRETRSYQPDPMTQTFNEEINYEYDRTDANPENQLTEASEVNFNMGFGERSGRVIQILKKGVSNISAATLSDVKQSQPVLKSVDLDNSNDVTTCKDDQIKKIRQHVNFIELRDKVRTFFKKSSLELKSEWITKTKDFDSNCNHRLCLEDFPFDLCSLDYMKPLPTNAIVQVVQVGQLPVSAAAQNPVTCDPRVTQVSDASPSQCSVDNSPNDDSQSEIKTEYTELTTADLTLPLQEYAQQNQTNLASNESNLELTEQTISLEMEIKAEESPEIKEEIPDITEEKSNSSDTDLHTLSNATSENMDYAFENKRQESEARNVSYNSTEKNGSENFSQQRQQNGTSEKTDQIAHAMNAAGITTTPETVTNTRAHALVNILSQKIRQGSVNTTQTTTNTYSKTTSINAMALQQALAQILPPPLNQTGSSENNQAQSTPVGPQVLHIVQGKNASGNQITLVDNSQQSVISTPNATQVLHIVQNKNATPGQATNGTLTPQSNSFSGLSLVDAGLQQGGNQLLHIVNAGNQKTASPGQLLKRVNLLTNLTNVQGSNEQKMVQFVCKSADGKAIQLNAPHQRSMVLRLQPIETPNVQTPAAKPTETQEPSPSPTGSTSGKESASQQEIKSRSIYEENYAKFIQNSSSKTPGLEKSTSLPKFNQAFGKPVFQEGQKQGEATNNNSHLTPVNTNTENAECPATDNAINLEHIGQISSPPLLLRKQPVVTSASQPNIVQQIKQTIAPMNIQTMHGGVIYTRQIPVNIGGGQTINLITVPSTELINDDSSKTQAQTNQGEMEPSIIKIVPQSQSTTNTEGSQEDGNNHASGSNENAQTPQPQPVLTQMRIKLPMLSKAPQMVPGARVVRPSFFQIQRNVIGGANQPVYQQLVLTAAPPLGQQTIRLPQASRPVKAPSESQSSSSESQMSTSTLEQLREFDMVLEQVKERSTVQPSTNSNNSSFKIHTSSSDTTDGNGSSNCSTESTPQVLYSIGNNQSLNVAYVNRKSAVTTPTTSTYVRSPDSTGIADSPTSSTHVQIPHTVTTDSSPTEMSSQSKPAKVGSKSKSRPKSTSNPPNTLKLNSVPPKTSSQKPLEDEQTTQRILYILAEYKEQVENSPDKDKPAPRRRSNPPSNPGSSKRKKSSSSRRSGTRDMSPVHGEDTCRTMGSEDSSCGTSQGDCTESCLDSHSPQDSPRKVARKITFDQELTVTQPRPQPQRNVIVADGQTITVARGATGKPATAVLMPANYILPVSMVKGGQQIAIVTNRGPKLLTVGGEGGATNALLLQRLIGPAGLKPVLARPGVRHVRLPTAALHNLQAFNLATATTVQPPDSTASPTPGPTPPELVDTRATSSPWTDRDDVKPERGSSPEGSEPWNLPSSADAHEYTYEETVRTDNMNRTVLVVQKKDGSQRQHRLSHVSAAALRHKYAILEHELRLQKSLSEECEDLGVDSPSASELFPEAELLFAASPAHDHNQEHHSHTPQPLHSSIPQPDMDDQIATDHLIPREIDVSLGLGDVGIVAVSEDGSATIALDQEEFARSHPNTTFHSEPSDGEVQPFTIAGLKGRHITSTIFHSNSAPATVLMTAPQATVISQAPDHSVKYEIENMINSMPSSHNNDINLSSVLVKDDGLTRFDNILTDSRELHLTNTASAIVHSSGNATQVIRRVCYEDEKRERDARYLIDEPDNLIAGDDAKMIAEDSSRDATLESMADVDDDRSSPERHAELFWESNSASERSEGRRPLDFSSDSDKCCKSPFDETNSTDSSGAGAGARLASVIKEAGSPPLRTYPAKRSLSGKTRAASPPASPALRRAAKRRAAKRGCPCCSGEPAPRAKRPRQRKPTLDFHAPH